MSWADDPVQYGTNSAGQTTRVGSVGGVAVNDYYGLDTNGTYGWIPMAPVSSATAPPSAPLPIAAVPPHLQFSASTIGTTVMLSWGRARLPGQIIWAAGIDADTSSLDTSLLTFAAAYCEPIDPNQTVEIITMSANGTLFYSGGAVLSVANISESDQASLEACIAGMTVYQGGETQLPDPTIQGYVGAGNVPAFRGLRYIVFVDFPLSISNNSVPNIVVEWRPVSGGPLFNVSDAMIALIEHVNLRSELRPIFAAPTVEGIPDQCYGLTITTGDSLISHFQSHKDVYSYQIVEADPIKIVRRAVDADLVIDFSVAEADIKADSGTPAVAFNRANLTQLPVGIDFSYTDPDQDFDTKVQPSRYEGSAPGNATGNPSGISSMSSAYAVDATTARTLAFEILYQMRSFAGKANFEIGDLGPEVSDVVQITSTEGDQYVVLVDGQTITKNKTNSIAGKLLLTSAGADINGDGGRFGGSGGRRKWPQQLMLADFIVTPSYIYTAEEFPPILSMNGAASPALRVGTSRYRDVQAADVTGVNWNHVVRSGHAAFPTTMFEDATYVYWISYPYLIISRLPKASTTINSTIETLAIPAGMPVDGTSANDNENLAGNNLLCFKDGKLYLPWKNRFNGVTFASSSDVKLVVVDIDAWSPTAWTLYDVFTYPGSGHAYLPASCNLLDNGSLVIPMEAEWSSPTSLFGAKYYVSTLADLSTWTTHDSAIDIDNNHQYSPPKSVGNKIYLPELSPSGLSHAKHRIAIADFSAGFSESVVDLTDDANVQSLAQVRGFTWVSDTHLFIYCNHLNYTYSTDFPVIAPRRYIARRNLSDGSAAGGKFVDEILWNGMDFALFRGHYFEGKNYLHWDAFDRTCTRFTRIDEDLDPTTATTWWPQQAATPTNNNFAAAKTAAVDTTYALDMRYCSTEVGETYPPWAFPITGAANDSHTYHNGHSLWFKFVAPSTGTATVTVQPNAQDFFHNLGVVAWTGTDFGTLAAVASKAPSAGTFSSPSVITFAATSGVTYYISTYFYNGSSEINTNDVFGGGFDEPGLSSKVGIGTLIVHI